MKVCQMLVMIAGTITMASACAGGIVRASRPIDTVGKPRPITPLMKPASRNAAAIRRRRGSSIAHTLADPRQPHNRAWPQTLAHDENGYRAPRQEFS